MLLALQGFKDQQELTGPLVQLVLREFKVLLEQLGLLGLQVPLECKDQRVSTAQSELLEPQVFRGQLGLMEPMVLLVPQVQQASRVLRALMGLMEP